MTDKYDDEVTSRPNTMVGSRDSLASSHPPTASICRQVINPELLPDIIHIIHGGSRILIREFAITISNLHCLDSDRGIDDEQPFLSFRHQCLCQ
jgi:hypothetical protein